MADSANTLPVMTDEQRRKNLEKAAAARRERKALLDLVREGTVSFEKASADPKYWRIPVVRLLIAVPGVGKAKATQLMTEAGVSPTRSSQGTRLPSARIHHREPPESRSLNHVSARVASLFGGGYSLLCRRHCPASLPLAGEGAAVPSRSSWILILLFHRVFPSFPTFLDSFLFFLLSVRDSRIERETAPQSLH